MKYAKKIWIILILIAISIWNIIPTTFASNIDNEEYNRRLQEAREITESINPTENTYKATTTNSMKKITENSYKSIKNKSVIVFIAILFCLWLICNFLLKKIIYQYNEVNDFVKSALTYRKTIMFDIFTLLFLYILNINLFKYIAIVYYIVIILTETILITIAIVSGIKDKSRDSLANKSLWILTISKILNQIASVLMLVFLYKYL